MKRFFPVACLLIAGQLALATAQQAQYLTAKPMSQVVTATPRSCAEQGQLKVPVITWGGDMATVLAEINGTFKDNGLSVSLFCENNFAKQVDKFICGETPYLRGTLGMICAAADACKAKKMDLVVIYQLTYSVGGDAMVARSGKSIRNIGTLALQLYGPHMDYAANIFRNAGRLPNIKFKWLKELTLPTYDSKVAVDPVTAFQTDPTLDAAMCISIDANKLTSGGKTGTGSEGSVKGATIALTTKTASRVIADVYAVRKDYLESNRADVQKFVHALMQSEEALRDLIRNKSSQQANYRKLLSRSADLLLDAPQATADAEGMLGDCEFVGYSGNIAFFTGKGTTRSLQTITAEIQGSFLDMGLMTAKVPLTSAEWDYTELATGLKYATNVPVAREKFDAQKVAAAVQQKIAVEPTSWEEEGTLFMVEINFGPNQSDFPPTQYAADFKKALGIAQTYGGALIVIEGHSDPLGVLKAKQAGEKKQVIDMMSLQAKNLSLSRAQAVRKSFLEYCKKSGLVIDESQFVAVGLGIASPKYNPPQTKDEWAANRRVVFRIKQVEAEATEFTPLTNN